MRNIILEVDVCENVHGVECADIVVAIIEERFIFLHTCLDLRCGLVDEAQISEWRDVNSR